MRIDASPSTISLNPAPEDYIFYLTFDPSDAAYKDFALTIFLDLLCSGGDASGRYAMSLYDLFFFRSKLKEVKLDQHLYLSDKATAVLQKHIEKVNLIHDLKAGKWNDKLTNGVAKTNLFSDQKAAVAFGLAHQRSGNWNDVGLGKTLISLAWYGHLKRRGKASRLVILCLNSNKKTWKDEIVKHTDWIDHTVIVRNGTEKVLEDLERFIAEDKSILVCHYDALLGGATKQEAYTKKGGKKNKKEFDPNQSEILQRIKALRPNACVFDEAHSLQHVEANRTKCVFNFLDVVDPTYLMLLTATPISETPLNAHSVLQMIKPQIIPSKTRFVNHFCNMHEIFVSRKNKKTGGRYRTKRKIPVIDKKKPYKNLSELATLVELYGFRKTHDDVEGMPEKMDSVAYATLEGEQKRIYDAIANEAYEDIAAMPQKAANLDLLIVKTLRLRQALSHPEILGEKGDSCKYRVVDNLVEQHLANPSSKLIIWSYFKHACDIMAERYKDFGAVPFHGGVKAKLLDKYEEGFQDGDWPRIIVATPAKAGTGKNLHRARLDIWVDCPIKYRDYEQGRGRIERRVAKGTSVHISLFAPNTIDSWVVEVLAMKRKYKTRVMDPDAYMLTYERDRLLQHIKGEVEIDPECVF